MAKKIVAVNASPRIGWNTDTLVSDAARGAEEAGLSSSALTSTGWKSSPAASPASAAKRKNSKGTASAGTD